MATLKQVEHKKLYVGKLAHDGDLLEEITAFCKENDIQLGWINAIGAVKKARLAFYNQQTYTYEFYDIDQPLEITNLTGNISIKDGSPMVHAHVTLANAEGRAFGGHVGSGTIIFACEIVIRALDGPKFERGYDEATKLPLWDL